MYNPYQREKKIPTPVALLSLVLLVLIIPLVFKKTSPNTTKAKLINYSLMQVSNLTYQSASISWKTDKKISAWIMYGTQPNNLNKTAYDGRDLSDQKNVYTHHYVSLSDLEPNKMYYYKIITPEGVITQNDKPFSFSTTQQFTPTNNQGPSFGKVINANGSPAQTLVLLTVDNSLTLSSLTKETTGEFLIPTYYLLTRELQIMTPKPDSSVLLTFIGDDGTTSHVKTLFQKIGPLDQTIILGKDYDFTVAKENVLGAQKQSDAKPTKKIDIIFPAERAVIPGDKPLFKGVAVPGSTVQLSLVPSIFSLQALTDKDGVWKVSSNVSLPANTYTLTMRTADDQNKPVVIKRIFSIGKSGEAVLGEATASATLTPTQPPIATPTIVFTTNTPVPTSVISTLTPTPTLPETGVTFMSLTIVSVALIIIGAGIILIF